MKKWMVYLVMLGVVLLGGTIVYQQNKDSPLDLLMQNNSESEKAEEVTIELDFSEIAFDNQNNETIQLSDYIGKPIVLNMWASWCPPCREEMPDLQKSWQAHQDEVEYFLVNDLHSRSSETVENVEEFLVKNEIEMPIFYDHDKTTMKAVQANILPSTVFIDKEGEVSSYHRGKITAEELERQVQKILE